MKKLNVIELIIEIKKRLLNSFCNMGSGCNKIDFAKKINRRTFLTNKDSLHISADMKFKSSKLSQEAKSILKQHIKNPENLLAFVKSNGTPVIKAHNIDIVLALIGETEGFIMPLNGLKALFLTIMINILSNTKISISFKTPAMFVMRNMPVNIYYLAHQFHHWFSYIKGLPGYEEKTMENFRNIWKRDFDWEDIDKMPIDEILNLKDAIERDLQAIKFVKEISREFIGSKNFIDRLKKGESLNL